MSVDKTQQSREQTREELAETLEALAHKADVKARATSSAQQAWSRAKAQLGTRGIIIVGGLGALVVVVVLRSRRKP